MKRMLMLIGMIWCIALGIHSQGFYAPEIVNTIYLTFPQQNWDQILDQLYAAGEDRLLGTAVINGVQYDSVGVRYKGNSSYNVNRTKNPFNIKLDYVIEDQLLDGVYGTIKLANGFSDPSLVRETLAYEIARKYMPASKANYAVVYVNGTQIGVYTNVQDVDSHFMRTHFYTQGKPRFKSNTNSMNPITVWGYLGADSTSYQNYYALESNYGWNTLINFTNTLQNSPANIAEAMNVDQNLWMIAFDNLLVNLDSPISIFHNFYLFADADNRINPLLWDLNMAFGGFPQNLSVSGMQNMDPLRNSTSNTYLLIKNILSNARYKKMYIAHMRTMITENFSNGWYATRAAELQSICAPYVQADPNFFYTYANFQANLNSSVSGGSGGPGGGGTLPGITQLMNTRATYLLNNTNFTGTVPTLVSHSHSPQNILPGTSVLFTATATNATYMQIGIRQNIANKFEYFQMYDDGTHGDGAANDGTYGVNVPISTGDIQYYFWAENSAQGMFFPPRAEHEFFTLEVASTTGEIVINEIMAKNASFPDPNGELDDWVELYNPNDYPVDIGGMYMTDSHYTSGVSAWTQIPTSHPSITTIPPHGYLVVWYDEDIDQGPLHVNDKLGGTADAVYLIAADGQTVIDSYTWTETQDLNVNDRTIGRSPDGSSNWLLFGAGQTNSVTQGFSNGGIVNNPPSISQIAYSPLITSAQSIVTVSANVSDPDNNLQAVYLQYGVNDYTLNTVPMTSNTNTYSGSFGPFPLGSTIKYRIKAVDDDLGETISPVYSVIIGYSHPVLYINELMASNTTTITDNADQYEDWVEIFNPNSFDVDLAGYYLTDNHYPEIGTSLSQIPNGDPSTIIPAGSFKLIWFDEHMDQGALHINTKLGTSADAVYLIAPDLLTVVDFKAWTAEDALSADVSLGRIPDGTSNWVLFGGNNTHPATPGYQNLPSSSDDEDAVPMPLILSVYPNPSKGSINIEVSNTKSHPTVQIFNLKGQLIQEYKETAKIKWDGKDRYNSKVGAGIYFVRIENNGKFLYKKLCITN